MMNTTRVVKLPCGFSFTDSSDQGHQITEAEVRLLTRADRKVIFAPGSPDERQDIALLKRITRLGDITDANTIATALDYLPLVDEDALQKAIVELDTKFVSVGKADLPAAKAMTRSSDIVSDVFSLNPGVIIDGREQKSCVVRLMRRGEWKQVDAEPDSQKRDDLALYFNIVQLGDCTDVTLEHLDQICLADYERINAEVRKLEDSFRTPKDEHKCGACGQEIPAGMAAG
jgi:hypothetical protein